MIHKPPDTPHHNNAWLGTAAINTLRISPAAKTATNAITIIGLLWSFFPVWPKDTRAFIAKIIPLMTSTVKLCNAVLLY